MRGRPSHFVLLAGLALTVSSNGAAQQAPWAGPWQNCPSASRYAQTVFNEVVQVAGVQALRSVRLCQSTSVPNAMATVMAEMRSVPHPWHGMIVAPFPVPVIFYNPNFMAQIDVAANNPMVAKGILAHELGHHNSNFLSLQNPWATMTHPWAEELKADEFAGMVLARMGANSDDIIVVYRHIFTLTGSPTHPPTAQRIAAVVKGYRTGGGTVQESTLSSNMQQALATQVYRWFIP